MNSPHPKEPVFLVPEWPAPANIRALVTTRQGGMSLPPYAGFNLAMHVGDDPVAVSANRELLRRTLPSEPRWLTQVHGLACVDASVSLPGAEADASIVRVPGVVCAVMTADCLPVLFCNRTGDMAGIAHAGWRGLCEGVIEATVKALDCPPEELLVWLGPAIGPAAYEVGEEVRAAFIERDAGAGAAFVAHGEGKWLCDLYALARRRLAALDVTAVYGGGLCTFSDTSRFYSYRRDGVTGRMASLIWISED